MLRAACHSAVVVVVLLASGCAYVDRPQPTPVPTAAVYTGRIKNDDLATGAAFFSDDEFKAMELRVVNLDDLGRYPRPAVKLAPQTRVQILDSRTLNLLGGGAGTTRIPMIFDRVRVLEGPAKDREGWVGILTLE